MNHESQGYQHEKQYTRNYIPELSSPPPRKLVRQSTHENLSPEFKPTPNNYHKQESNNAFAHLRTEISTLRQ